MGATAKLSARRTTAPAATATATAKLSARGTTAPAATATAKLSARTTTAPTATATAKLSARRTTAPAATATATAKLSARRTATTTLANEIFQHTCFGSCTKAKNEAIEKPLSISNQINKSICVGLSIK